MTEKRYLAMWIMEIECGVASANLVREGKKATLRAARMSTDDHEELKRGNSKP